MNTGVSVTLRWGIRMRRNNTCIPQQEARHEMLGQSLLFDPGNLITSVPASYYLPVIYLPGSMYVMNVGPGLSSAESASFEFADEKLRRSGFLVNHHAAPRQVSYAYITACLPWLRRTHVLPGLDEDPAWEFVTEEWRRDSRRYHAFSCNLPTRLKSCGAYQNVCCCATTSVRPIVPEAHID